MRVLRHAVAPLAMLLAAACGEPPASHQTAAPPELPVQHEIVLGVPDDSGQRDAVVAVVDARLRDVGLGHAIADPGDATLVVCRLTTTVPAEIATARALVTRPGTLVFRICVDGLGFVEERALRQAGGATYEPSDPRYQWLPYADERDEDVLVLAEEQPFLTPVALGVKVERPELDHALETSVFTQDDIDVVRVQKSPVVGSGSSTVYFGLRSDRRAAFERFTAANVNRQIAIVVDGRVDSEPVIRSPLPGEGILEGGGMGYYTEQEARSLAAALRSRPLPTRVEIVEERAPK